MQRGVGALNASEYDSSIDDYHDAMAGYRGLIDASEPPADPAAAEALRTNLLEFTGTDPGQEKFASVLSQVTLERGPRGEVLVDRDSLQETVDKQIKQIGDSLPEGADPGPALAYLAHLQQNTDASIGKIGHDSPSLPIAAARRIATPIQQYQARMSGNAWQIRLNLKTTPTQAVVVFTAMKTFSEQFLSNTSRLMTRGMVNYMVTKAGYKTIVGEELNLVSAHGDFTCVLVPETEAQPAYPCNIQ